jgi:hypothetical protein
MILLGGVIAGAASQSYPLSGTLLSSSPTTMTITDVRGSEYTVAAADNIYADGQGGTYGSTIRTELNDPSGFTYYWQEFNQQYISWDTSSYLSYAVDGSNGYPQLYPPPSGSFLVYYNYYYVAADGVGGSFDSSNVPSTYWDGNGSTIAAGNGQDHYGQYVYYTVTAGYDEYMNRAAIYTVSPT